MAHPHALHPKDHRDKARAVVGRTGHDVPRGKMRYKAGGAVTKEWDEEQDHRDISRGVHLHEAHLHKGQPKTKLKAGGAIEGREAKAHLGKRARGGMTGKKGTHVNVIVAPQGAGGAGRPMMPAAQPMVAPRPAAPMQPRPAAPPGGMPPQAMGPGIGQRPPGMMKRGGGVKDNDAADAAEYEQGRATSGTGGAKRVIQAGTPWKNILHSKRGGKVARRDVGGMTGMPAPAGASAQPPAGQMTPQQQQAVQQAVAQRAAQARMNPAAGAAGVPQQKRGGRTERARGGHVPHMEAGAGSGEGRIEKVHEYGGGRGFIPREHKGELVRRRG